MDKNVLNVSYYDTKTKTGGSVQIQRPTGDKLLSQILEAAKPKPSVINIMVEEPKRDPIANIIKQASEGKEPVVDSMKIQEGQQPSCRLSKFVCPSIHSDVEAVQENYQCTLNKGAVFPTSDSATAYANAALLPNLGRTMSEIQAEKEAEQRTMGTEKTFKIKNLDKPLVVLFNGPPRSGKDSACEIIMRHFPEVHYAYFKEVLYKESAKILGLDFNFWASVCQNGDLKDKPMLTVSAGETGGVMTPRDILIYLAEKVLKPKYGQDFIARETANTIAELIQFQREQSNEEAVIVVPDLGFDYEIDTIRKMIPDAHVISVAVHRPGFTFEGDSRNYVKGLNFGLHNTENYEDLKHKVLRLFRNIVLDIRPIPTIETMGFIKVKTVNSVLFQLN